MLSLSQASRIVDSALSKARELELRPLTITVLDPGGHPLVVKREDVSGDRPENDESCAVAGVKSTGPRWQALPRIGMHDASRHERG
jgi:uncharacterized protein GlcG (DUF336 family)